jgi:hypothetical protein
VRKYLYCILIFSNSIIPNVKHKSYYCRGLLFVLLLPVEVKARKGCLRQYDYTKNGKKELNSIKIQWNLGNTNAH